MDVYSPAELLYLLGCCHGTQHFSLSVVFIALYAFCRPFFFFFYFNYILMLELMRSILERYSVVER